MSLDRLGAEDRAFVTRVVEVTTGFGSTVAEAATAYVSLNPTGQELEGEARLPAQELIERIAEQWRQAELVGATHVTAVEELQSEPVLSLLGAIEDSLVLALTSDPRHRALMVSLDETVERTSALAGSPEAQEELSHPQAAEADEADEAPEELARRFDDLHDILSHALGEASGFFVALGKGGDLDEDELRSRVEELAVCLRTFDIERDLVAAFSDRLDVRPSLALLRTMLHALVLRLSEDPARRAQAISISELGTRAAPVFQEWEAVNRASAG